ncbi:endoribonuclease Dcr-1-like protein, partial [Leptotrombidium deliense]
MNLEDYDIVNADDLGSDMEVEDSWWMASVDDDDNDESMEIVDSDEDWDKVYDEQSALESDESASIIQEEEIVQQNVSNNNVSAIKSIEVKRVDERNLAFNPVPVDKIGAGMPLKLTVNRSIENFDWNNFRDKIESNLKQTYKRIRSEFTFQSGENDNIEPDAKQELCETINEKIKKDERIESFDEAREVVDTPNANLILQAFTSKRCDDILNFERLEMIGDSFLKFSSALYMFCKFPELSVDFLVRLKHKQVSNFNLYRFGKGSRISKKMGFYKFNPSRCISSAFNEDNEQEIDDKSVADCVEALIEAYLLKSGP